MYSYVKNILQRRNDIDLICEEPCCLPMGIEVYSKQPEKYDAYDKTLFDHCSDEELTRILEAFLEGRLNNVGYSTAIELACALSLFGSLITEKAECLLLPKVKAKDNKVSDMLYWAYFGSDIKYETICLDLLKEEIYFLDGIYIALYNLNTENVHNALSQYWCEKINKKETLDVDIIKMFLDKWDVSSKLNAHFEIKNMINRDWGSEGRTLVVG